MTSNEGIESCAELTISGYDLDTPLLSYTGDVDLDVKLEGWQDFYNYHRPHSALEGKTPYEPPREKLSLNVAQARVE